MNRALHRRIIAVVSGTLGMLFNQNKSFFLTLDESAEPVRLDLPKTVAVEESSTPQQEPQAEVVVTPPQRRSPQSNPSPAAMPTTQQRFRPPPRPSPLNSPQARPLGLL